MLDDSGVGMTRGDGARPLHESLLLLLLERGDCSGGVSLDAVLAGGVLVDLTDQGCIAIEGTDVVAAGRAPAGGGLLGAAASNIASEGRRRGVRRWMEHLPRQVPRFRACVAERLVSAGTLAVEQHRALGLFPRTRVVVVDPGPGRAVVEEVRSTLLGLRSPALREAELAGLVEALGLVGNVVDRDQRKSAARLARELLTRSDAAVAVAQAIQAIRAETASAAAAGATGAVVASST